LIFFKFKINWFKFKLSYKNNTRLNKIMESLEYVRTNDAADIPTTTFNLNEIVPTRFKKYYRYPGSLTNPTCSEVFIYSLSVFFL